MKELPGSLGAELIRAARSAVRASFSGSSYRMKPETRRKLSASLGVFVNIYSGGSLRGSLGYPPGTYSLADGIRRAARGAAFKDPRFASLTEKEFNNSRFEVVLIEKLEVLKVRKPEECFGKINPKKHGIHVRYGPFSAMQLPVFVSRRGLSPRDFLEKTVEKSGLAPEQWKSPNMKVSIFETARFSE